MNSSSSDVFLSNLGFFFLLHPSYFHLLKTGSSSPVNWSFAFQEHHLDYTLYKIVERGWEKYCLGAHLSWDSGRGENEMQSEFKVQDD